MGSPLAVLCRLQSRAAKPQLLLEHLIHDPRVALLLPQVQHPPIPLLARLLEVSHLMLRDRSVDLEAGNVLLGDEIGIKDGGQRRFGCVVRSTTFRPARPCRPCPTTASRLKAPSDRRGFSQADEGIEGGSKVGARVADETAGKEATSPIGRNH